MEKILGSQDLIVKNRFSPLHLLYKSLDFTGALNTFYLKQDAPKNPMFVQQGWLVTVKATAYDSHKPLSALYGSSCSVYVSSLTYMMCQPPVGLP